MKFRMTDLNNFLQTSTCRTISEGAIKLGISQPALTESLKRLESDLNQILFYRSRSGIQITPFGREFLIKTERALLALRSLENLDDGDSVFHGQSIRIGCHSTVGQYVLPPALTYLAEQAPDYKIELRHDFSRNIQLEVQRGNLDIGIVVNPVDVPDLVIKKIGADVVKVWSGGGRFDSGTLFCNTQLFQTQNILRKWKKKPQKIVDTDSLELICQLVGAGLGYGIIPSRAVALSSAKLSSENDLPSFSDVLSIVYRPEFGSSRAEALTREALTRSLTKK